MKLKFCVILVVSFALNISAVRITSLGVPSTYVLDQKLNLLRPLILDCDYEFRVNDKGFVLKWYHNRRLVSQWIPPKKPYIFNGNLNYHINSSFFITDSPNYKYRAIQLKPLSNLTGDWMCSVQTYHTRDRQIKRLEIIVSEKSFRFYHPNLKFLSMLESFQFYFMICTVKEIIPEPSLYIVINDKYKTTSEVQTDKNENGFFNKSIMTKIDKRFMSSPSTITCVLKVNGSNYIKKKQFIFYENPMNENESKNDSIISDDVKSSGKWLVGSVYSVILLAVNVKLLSLFFISVEETF